MTEVQNLEVLEQRAEKALETAEHGWREFAETMREIKESGAHKEADYRYFQPYYRDRWETRTGKAFESVRMDIYGLRILEEMESVLGEDDLTLPRSNRTAGALGGIADPRERVEFWRESVLPDKPDGRVDHTEVHRRLREYKGTGVIEKLDEAGVAYPAYPEGPSDEEVAYRKLSDLAAVAKDVTPEAAARAVSSSTAYSVAPNYDFLLPWVRSFLAELHIRAGR